MLVSRRQLLQHGTTSAALTAVPFGRADAREAFNALAALGAPARGATPAERQAAMAVLADPKAMRALAARAVDAAKAAGASYADARLTRTVTQQFLFQDTVRVSPQDSEMLGLGVRVLVNDYWGFAASPYWTADEAVRLAKDAVAEARANAKGGSRRIELGTLPATIGDWATVGTDPFSIPIEEKVDWMNAWRQAVTETTHPKVVLSPDPSLMQFVRQERVLMSTEGTSASQTITMSHGAFIVTATGAASGQEVKVPADGLAPRCQGWEMFPEARILDQIPALAERAAEDLSLVGKPVEVAKYDVVLSGQVMTDVLASTIGLATQLDRAIGWEANAGGTSYLGPDPLALLGTFQAASPLVTVTADRSVPGGLATAKWDDDGVVPDDFTLVKDGVLVDYQTTREQAAWLAPYYQKAGKPVRSHGCAWSLTAHQCPTQQPPNLALAPGVGSVTFDDLVKDTKRGLAVVNGGVNVDFQGRGGTGMGMIREIINGRLGAVVIGAGFLFDSTELWKNVVALGGAGSTARQPKRQWKGQPFQTVSYDVRAVPAKVKDMTIIDVTRRA